MTMNDRDLREWEESMHILLTEKQRADILEQFGSEPEPQVWSEQDIAEQIRCYLQCGSFIRPRINHGSEMDFTEPF